MAPAPDSYPMQGGDGTFSYSKNSNLQRAAISVVQGMLFEAISEKLDVSSFLGTSTTTMGACSTIRVADLGCSVGPNTFEAMQNVIEAMESKLKKLDHSSSPSHQYQVYFNDHTENDFNTLLKSLPANRSYFSAAVPGSFHGRLFPDSSMHFFHSSHSLQWLSRAPEEVFDKSSPAWNPGRIHYTCAPKAVVEAYAHQYALDIEVFLQARAQELVVGGMVIIVVACVPHESVPHSEVAPGVIFDIFGQSLLDLAQAGVVREEQVDTFNLPIYTVSPQEMERLVAKNGRFRIERMELANPSPPRKPESDSGSGSVPGGVGKALAEHLRAGMGGVFAKHFGAEILDPLFEKFYEKVEENKDRLGSCMKEGSLMFVALVKQH